MPDEGTASDPYSESDVLKALVNVRGRAIARRMVGADASALPEGLAVARSRHAGVVVVAVAGDLDVNTAPAVREVLSQAVDDGPVIVDLQGVAFIDSMGLGALVAARRRSPGRIAVVVAETQEVIRKVFTTTAIDRVLPVTATLDEAAAALGTDD